MKKLFSLWICFLLLVPFAAGCSTRPERVPDSTEAPIVTEAPAVTETPIATEAPVVTEPPAPTEAPAEPGDADALEEPAAVCGHYSFLPKVCSSYMTEVFGEVMTETWYHLVDAVLAGEDTFACPDADTYNWVMGQYPDKCFPILTELIDYCYDRSDPVHDGIGSFTYLVPREEAAARIEEFAALVEGILNETLEDDYSDFEKALALYIYFSHHYIYDHEAARPDIYADYLSSYRVLTTGIGICQEFSVAYSYLLLQAGVDASTMSGYRSWDGALHQWSYVRINGHNYHIDPTYVICDADALSYFMMTDEQREWSDGYSRDTFVICSHYSKEHPHPDYAADDDSFRAIWRSWYMSIDHSNRILNCLAFNEEEQLASMYFDYTGW